MDKMIHRWMFLGLVFSTMVHTHTPTSTCGRGCTCSIECLQNREDICPLEKSEASWKEMECEILEANSTYDSDILVLSKSMYAPNDVCALTVNSPVLMFLSVRMSLSKSKSAANCTSSNLQHLDISGGNLTEYPFESGVFQSLKTLNISGNILSMYHGMPPSSLHTLDLSNNSISDIQLDSHSGSKLQSLHLQMNMLDSIPSLKEFKFLRYLDLSFNKLGTPSILSHKETCLDLQHLPGCIETLNLRENSIKYFSNSKCSSLHGLLNLTTLDLGGNLLSQFSTECILYSVPIEVLHLDRNKLFILQQDAFSQFPYLRYLSLSHNRLKTITGDLLLELNLLSTNTKIPLEIDFQNNPFHCDCALKQTLENTIQSLHMTIEDIICSSPANLSGKALQKLDNSKLGCVEVVQFDDLVKKTCEETTNCLITCPHCHSNIHWFTPQKEVISHESLNESFYLNSTYDLSPDLCSLIVKHITISTTGNYSCVTKTTLSSTVIDIEVSISPSPLGSILSILISSVTFALAIAINCFNMCRCYCEALNMEEESRTTECKSDSLLKPSKQLGLHESEASLNANKYYRKYDFTCQHIFLDAVLKGAHTVKQTLYDARNSEFSNNVWEYASHFRDRLHIELPSSVHLPRVSMPSISLPAINISRLQSINSNFERLGTSVISRSHNLATSVGSVFSLRWLKNGGNENNSDPDSGLISMAEADAHFHPEENDKCKIAGEADLPSSSSCSVVLLSRSLSMGREDHAVQDEDACHTFLQLETTV